MPPKKSSKKSSSRAPTTAAANAAAREAKRKAEAEALRQWIESNDPLLDNNHSIKVDDLFTTILTRKTFALPSVGQVPYDWSVFRAVIEERSATSPRWYVQLREEDLLAGDDGMEGVTVNCFVVAEALVPTLSPAEYVVKTHWPYSDAEDNAPERILPIAGQGMCWRRVTKSDGTDVNMYLLQKRETAPTAAATPNPASGAFHFGFGSSSVHTSSPAASAAPTAAPVAGFGFGFGFGQQPPPTPTPPPTTAPLNFGFGAAPAAAQAVGPVTPASFGFGVPNTAATATAAAAATTAMASVAPPPSPSGNCNDDGSIKTQPLKTSEVLFCLWSKKRLTGMAQEVRSGSRIVREGFSLSPGGRTIKLVMENDRKDSVEGTVRRLVLNRLFAKQDKDVAEVDKWINDCPVYNEKLAAALQGFREQHVNAVAEESEVFAQLYNAYRGCMEAELKRIVSIRARAAEAELSAIADILERIRDHKLAEKSSFRLLKYYPKNDKQKFRPFGKVSGISEMGETADLCEPSAHVNINPFTGKAS